MDVKERMWVPAPPQESAGGRRGPAAPAASARRRARSRGAGLLVAAAAGVILVVACLLGAAVLPALARAGGGRTNILLLGIDRRSGAGWAYRTDTILVLTVDPASRAAGILSIPRDLQVPIPGYGEDRINTANFWGAQGQEENPDAGASLLKATIEGNFGVPIDGYLVVDFGTFVGIVDALGGIEVDVPKTLHDTRYPNPKPEDPYGYKTVHFDAGRQQMDGARAIEYARSRMSTSDFDRAKRQQLVLLAIRQKALSRAGVVRWPALASTVLAGVKTDLGVGGLLRLGYLAARMDLGSLQQVVLEHPLVSSYTRDDGAQVLLPEWELINPVIEELFGLR